MERGARIALWKYLPADIFVLELLDLELKVIPYKQHQHIG